jgi:hypothetical protein
VAPQRRETVISEAHLTFYRSIPKKKIDFHKQTGPYSIRKGKVMKFTGTGSRL